MTPRRRADRLTIRYPDGTAVRLTAGTPGATLEDGTALTLTGPMLRAAACQLVAHGLATVTGPGTLAATVTRPELLDALTRLPLTVTPAAASSTTTPRHPSRHPLRTPQTAA